MDDSEIAEILAEFFKEDPRKIVYWLFTENPNFGGCAKGERGLFKGEEIMTYVNYFLMGLLFHGGWEGGHFLKTRLS